MFIFTGPRERAEPPANAVVPDGARGAEKPKQKGGPAPSAVKTSSPSRSRASLRPKLGVGFIQRLSGPGEIDSWS